MPRPRKSNEQHKLSGTYRKDRHDKKPDVNAELFGIPERPDFIQDEAAIEWDRVTSLLNEQGVLTVLDRATLAHYCQLWQQLYSATDPLPLAFHGHFRMACQELGLTPASRTKVMPDASKKKDESLSGFERF